MPGPAVVLRVVKPLEVGRLEQWQMHLLLNKEEMNHMENSGRTRNGASNLLQASAEGQDVCAVLHRISISCLIFSRSKQENIYTKIY